MFTVLKLKDGQNVNSQATVCGYYQTKKEAQESARLIQSNYKNDFTWYQRKS